MRKPSPNGSAGAMPGTELARPWPRELELLEKAAACLAECQDLDEVRKTRDIAKAVQVYQEKINRSGQAAILAGEIKVRAEHRMGELLARMPKQRPGEYQRLPRATVAPRLSDLGIEKTESHRCQSIAAVPKEEFEAAISKAKRAGRAPTSKELAVRGQAIRRNERKHADLVEKARNAPPVDASRLAWEILEGDNVPGLQSIPKGSVRLIVADPPYNEGVDYGGHYDDRKTPAEYRALCRKWIAAAVPLLTPDGAMFVIISHEQEAHLRIALEEAGLHYRQTIIWYEAFGVHCTRKLSRCTRPILWMTRHRDKCVFNADAATVRSDRQDKYHDPRANPDGKVMDNLWCFDRVAGTHAGRVPGIPTQLPPELLARIVGLASDPGDLVADPFSGSGTTGVACLELGRRYIGIELSHEYAELSRLRLTGYKKGDMYIKN